MKKTMNGYTPSTEAVRVRYASLILDFDLAVGEFDRWLAAHDAEVRASVVSEETEWEYGTRCPMPECTEPHLLDENDAPPQPEESLWRRTRERYMPPGEWEPVEQEGSGHEGDA